MKKNLQIFWNVQIYPRHLTIGNANNYISIYYFIADSLLSYLYNHKYLIYNVNILVN